MLGLQIKITEKSNCKSFYFADVTPLYNSVLSPEGYDETGTVNLNPDDIDTDRLMLDVQLPDGSIINLTIPDTAFDLDNIVNPGLVIYEVTAASLGYSDKLQDGVYKFTYTIYNTDGTLTYNASCYVAQMCNVCCCLNEKLKDISSCTDCNSIQSSKKLDPYVSAYMLKEKVKFLLVCQDNTGAQDIIDYLSQYCGIKRCDSCN